MKLVYFLEMETEIEIPSEALKEWGLEGLDPELVAEYLNTHGDSHELVPQLKELQVDADVWFFSDFGFGVPE